MAALYFSLEWLGVAAAAVLLAGPPGDVQTSLLGVSGLGLAGLARWMRSAGMRGRS